MADDLALAAARLGAALRAAGVPADPGRCQRFARAVLLARPDSPRAVYLCAQATLTTSPEHAEILRRVFAGVAGFVDPGGQRGDQRGDQHAPSRGVSPAADILAEAARAARAHGARLARPPQTSPTHGAMPGGAAVGGATPGAAKADGAGDDRGADVGPGLDAALMPLGEGLPGARPGDGRPDARHGRRDEQAGRDEEGEPARPALASAAERLASTDFADLSPAELLLLSGLMSKLTLAVPLRRSRRPRRATYGRHTDLRSTLRQARRTGGHPIRLARAASLLEPRRLVVLCDISGSMAPYARAMLQLLYCAAGGARAEVFTFATRLTRLTRRFAHAAPDLALRRAGEAAPDWHGGTRIGDSLAEFNNRYGRRGMARGAVVVVISDGWDTGDPAILRREMERLCRVAHRIVWVNPRAQSPEYRPLAGGMAAAWPYCDAVVSAHSLHALDELTAALARPGPRRPPPRGRPAAR